MRQQGRWRSVTVFVVYALTSSYREEELEAFCMYPERLYKQHTFFKIIVDDFNANKTGPRRRAEEHHIGIHGVEGAG
ncbi:hypothetical protein V3C99_001160 [Haemonchus contortus]|uniref:Secreted protein n=1 Tax=Haemonchus contortus TaxID=6289 RepID=A0A7I5E9C2_HAECO